MLKNVVTVEKRHPCHKPAGADWIASVLRTGQSCLPGEVHFGGTHRRSARPDVLYERQDPEMWTNELQAEWAQVGSLDLWMSSDAGQISLSCNFGERELRLRVTAATEGD